MKFTKEEVQHIDKHMHWMVFQWAELLIKHIISEASSKGIKAVYMNSSETVDTGTEEEAFKIPFYEKLPQRMGFVSAKVNLRGKGEERMWKYDIVQKMASLNNFVKIAQEATIPLEKIPKSFQGACISIIGKKPFYTKQELSAVYDIVSKKKSPQKAKGFFYNWKEDEWDGGQQFQDGVNETVVTQRFPADVRSFIREDPILQKLWAMFLRQTGHFGRDVIGFALVNQNIPGIWVINEIQSDSVREYLGIRNKILGWDEIRGDKESDQEERKMSWNTIKDMLHAQDKTKWVPIIESNASLKEKIVKEPNLIEQLPADYEDIEQWIENRIGENGNIDDLFGRVAMVDFSTRIYKRH